MLKILIVDDDSDDAILTERVLRLAKVLNPIVRITSGEECVRYFRQGNCSAGGATNACLVFLDMMMVPVDGLSVLKILKNENLANDSIIVMLSGSTDLNVIQEGYRQGARTFLVKPFKAQDVAEVLKSLHSRIAVRRSPEGRILHWLSTPPSQQSSDTEFIRRSVRSAPEWVNLN